MKKCEVCNKQFADYLEECPYCDGKKTNSETVLFDNANEMNEESLSKVFCKYCGNEITNGSDYCNQCGHDIYDKGIKHCTNCGAVLEPKQAFCDKCGKKISVIKIPKTISDTKKRITKRRILVLTICLFIVVGLVVTGVKIIPPLFISYEEYMVEGLYDKAYEKAKEEEKNLVIQENIAANVSYLCKEKLKDSSSFVLREIYIEEDCKDVIIMEQGSNSFGGTVTGYVWFQWDNEKNEFISLGSCSDFDKEKVNSWDDTDDAIEKLADTFVKVKIKTIISEKKFKMNADSISRINELNKKGKLQEVKLLEEAKTLLSIEDEEKNS